MLHIAFALIGEATSNSLLMFCFCNLIIVMILTGSSKSGSMDSQVPAFATSLSFNTCTTSSDDCGDDDDEEEMTVSAFPSPQDESVINAEEEMTVSAFPSPQDESLINASSCHCCDDDGDDAEDDNDESKETDVEEEEEDDDLRKRAEEFIAKVNNEWKHEKLKALNLVY